MQSRFKKNMTIRSLAFATALTTTMVFFYGSVQARDNKDLYLRGGIGINWLTDADNISKVSSLNIESDSDSGFGLVGALGYRYNKNIRLEAEINYRVNDIDSIGITGSGPFTGLTANADGEITSLGGMANVYFDLDKVGSVKEHGQIVPYVMGGIGWVNVDANVSSNGTSIVDDDDSVFASQLGAGVGYNAAERITLDLGYRYYRTEDPDFTDSEGDAFKSEYENHSLMASVRYAF